MSKVTTTLLLCAALAACGKKKDEPATSPPAPTGSATVVQAPADAVAVATPDAAEAAAVEVPTEADFEDQAATDITEQTLPAKLSALEKELAP